MNTVNVNIRVKPEERERFNSACDRQNLSQAEVLRWMMREFANGTITFQLIQESGNARTKNR